MIRQAGIMVLWSFLLFSKPALASLENVLAPVDAGAFDLAAREAVTRDDRRPVALEEGPRPLVERGVDELDLLAELERQLSERIQPMGTLRLIPISQIPRLPRSAALPEVVLFTHPSKLTSSSAMLRFRLKSDGQPLGDYAVTFRVQVLAQVWTPGRRMSPGEPLLAGDLSTREADLVREPKAVVADMDLIGNYEISRAVTPDRALTWSDITPRALVRKGELVEVVAKGGLLSVSMKGQATRSGSMGEVVTIRNLESKREFSAEVIDENRVRVRF